MRLTYNQRTSVNVFATNGQSYNTNIVQHHQTVILTFQLLLLLIVFYTKHAVIRKLFIVSV